MRGDASHTCTPPARRVFRPAVATTVLLVIGQATTALTYSAMAALFGRSYVMDAYLAGVTLPQYVIAVLIAALTFVLVPVLTEYAGRDEREAAQLAGQLLTVIGGALLVLTLAGAFVSSHLIALMIPGLSPESHRLAVQVSWLAWPSVLGTGLAATLTAMENAENRFAWAAAVPAIGSLVTFGLVVILARAFGAAGLAAAMTVGVMVQVVLLGAVSPRRYRIPRDLRHPGVVATLHLLWPLALSGIFIRATPILDRYLVSNLGEGSIASLGYAGNISRFLALAVSAGVATVIFPQLATLAATSDRSGLRRLISGGLRMMWLVVAPMAVIGMALAKPVIGVAFERGNFGAGDTVVVASLFQIYLGAFIVLCLGNISGRALYALRMTRLVAALSVAESLIYFAYNTSLVRWLGVSGAASAYFLYCFGSLAWQLVLIKKACGGRRLLPMHACAQTLVAAIAGGLVSAGVGQVVVNPWLALGLGGLLGLLTYVWFIGVLNSAEGRLVWSFLRRRLLPARRRRRSEVL